MGKTPIGKDVWLEFGTEVKEVSAHGVLLIVNTAYSIKNTGSMGQYMTRLTNPFFQKILKLCISRVP